jgi:hypothetical protein
MEVVVEQLSTVKLGGAFSILHNGGLEITSAGKFACQSPASLVQHLRRNIPLHLANSFVCELEPLTNDQLALSRSLHPFITERKKSSSSSSSVFGIENYCQAQ